MELKEWRAKNVTLKKRKGAGKGAAKDDTTDDEDKEPNKKKWRREVASVFCEELKRHQDHATKEKEEVESIKVLLVSFANAKPDNSKPSQGRTLTPDLDQVTVAATKLQSILKNGRNSSKNSDGK